MRYERYRRIDKAIKASDNGGVWERWRYGRRLLCDSAITTPRGYLQHGKLTWIVQRSRVSEREIQWRLQCARAYPTETQIRNAITDFGTWLALIQAGFPPYPAPEGERPYNPLETDELIRQQQAASDRAAEDALYEDGGLIPREFSDDTLLHEFARYVEVQVELASRFTERVSRLESYLDALIKAVAGNMHATLGEAKHALHGD